MIEALQKKAAVAYLQSIKVLYPSGKKVRIRSPYGSGLYFWLDEYTDNGFILGFYERELAEVLYDSVKKDTVFYDLGAHWGYFSILAAKFVGPGGTVYTFEPMPDNYKRLVRNIQINEMKNVEALNLAVSNTNGVLRFSNCGDTFANTYINDNEDNAIEVKAVSLDKFVQQERILPPNFIKIDVEGAEADVLEGAEQTIRKYRPTIHLSTHNIHLKGVDERCKAWLKKEKYEVSVLSLKDGIADYICRPLNA
jgi:FkbM family methyltransferase